MPLQNRVDPFGAIVANGARGMFTGNRGIIHDPSTRTLLKKRWSTRAWIICACEFQGRRRTVMGAHNNFRGGIGWTELFFHDEVTALAAGHRPCFTCRRERARDFMGGFAAISGITRPKVPDIDRRLHAERLASGGKPAVVTDSELPALPDGAMVAIGDRAFAVRSRKLLPWSFEGYGAPLPIADRPELPVLSLTPPTTVEILRAGYRPAWHHTAA